MRLEGLPPPPKPAGAYRPVIIVGDMAFLSGFGPRNADGTPLVGMVGRDLDLEAAQAAARNVGQTILSVLQETLGDLDRVRQIVRITGMIACPPDFTQHPKVLDGCSLLLAEVVGGPWPARPHGPAASAPAQRLAGGGGLRVPGAGIGRHSAWAPTPPNPPHRGEDAVSSVWRHLSHTHQPHLPLDGEASEVESAAN